MGRCRLCNKSSKLTSAFVGLCVDCIRNDFVKSQPLIESTHQKAREEFHLSPQPPRNPKGIKCNLCLNACRTTHEEKGYCGLTIDSRKEASLEWYYDNLPTNCVAEWVCPGCSGSGFPEFSYSQTPEYGYKNLAVFYTTCSFDCLFCQNWHFRQANLKNKISAQELASKVDQKTSCICFFGGDPTPQIPHALQTSRLALRQKEEKHLRICWETNGSMDPKYLREALKLSLDSGGCIKFDLKAGSEELNIALCGITNKRTFENLKIASSYIHKRPSIPLVVASTLLIPGYVDFYEIQKIAKFIAEIDPTIPYCLLAFHPSFFMDDLPYTSRGHAYKAKEVASRAGLTNVKIGNLQILSYDY